MQVLCLLAVLVPLVTCLSVPPVEPIYPVRHIRICPIPLCVAPDELSARPACRNQCNTDQDCGAGGLCCPLCGCNSCVGGTGPVTRPLPTDTCKTKRCPAGQVCKLQTIFCVKAPCPGPFATCVPSTKPGSCPALACAIPLFPRDCAPVRQCTRDTDCTGNLKCCRDCSGCPTCAEPWHLQPATCATLACPRGTSCVPFPEPHCENQGVCPRPSGLVSTCEFVPGRDCVSDADCVANQKCCSEGCGKRCKTPILP